MSTEYWMGGWGLKFSTLLYHERAKIYGTPFTSNTNVFSSVGCEVVQWEKSPIVTCTGVGFYRFESLIG